MIEITLKPIPAQQFTVNLAGQSCKIRIVYSKFTDQTFLDLSINDIPICNGVLCLNGVKIIRDSYLGFTGDLVFLDLKGSDDPDYRYFGERFKLYYIQESD